MTLFRKPIKVYAVRDKNEDSLRRAASGGAFSVLARPVIDTGGIVFGARSLDGGAVRHCQARSREELSLLQGSAYVQSDMSGIYNEVVSAVKSGVMTMFVGTPCQCAAVVSYLRAKCAIDDLEGCGNLLVCDLICHGTPNGKLFRAHQEWLARKVGADDGIHSFKFRSKKNGWGLYYYYYYFRNGKKREVCDPGDCDPYYAAFLRGETYRECCYSCPFSRRERVTDFTIGDYWGIESSHPGFFDSKGVSVLLTSTEKGTHWFEEKAAGGCLSIESDFASAARENHNLNAPTVRPRSRDRLLAAVAARCATGEIDALFDVDLKPKRSFKSTAKKLLPASVFGVLKRVVKVVKN